MQCLAHLTLIQKCVQGVNDRISVFLSQKAPQSPTFGATIIPVSTIIYVNIQFFRAELRHSPVGKVQNITTLHRKYLVDDLHIDAADGRWHGSGFPILRRDMLAG
jgi:hypothetical protein